MRRRPFLAGVAGALALPFPVRAQPARLPVIGYLSSTSRDVDLNVMEDMRKGLEELGFIDGRNVVIERRFAEGQYDRLPVLARELAALPVDVFATRPTVQAALAAKAVTSTIPVVFNVGVDPVEIGLVAAYNRPGGNVTGVTSTTVPLDEKRLEIVLELVPARASIAMLFNSANPVSVRDANKARQHMEVRGKDLAIIGASTAQEIDAAFDLMVRRQASGLVVAFEGFFSSTRQQIISLAHRHRIWAVYPLRVYAESGGLVSYGPKLTDINRTFGNYVGRVLRGDRPADLPGVTPARYELVINQKSARENGFTIPPSILARADEVIE